MATFDEETPLISSTSKVTNGNGGNTDKGGRSLRLRVARSLSQISTSMQYHLGKIGFLGSMAIAVNSLTGPAMLNLPDTFQRAGIIPTVATVLFVCSLSALCCLHMANTISKVHGNWDFKKEVEYSETFEKFWGHRSFLITQMLFFCCITCLNVSSIVDTAQVIDTIIGHLIPSLSVAFNIRTDVAGNLVVHVEQWDYSLCSEQMFLDGTCLPFLQTEGVVFTFGYAVLLLIFLPMALMDLKENTTWQVLGYIVLLVSSLQFIVLFIQEGLSFDNISWWGESWDTLFGVVLFNFALVIAVPAWLYEKEPHVDVPTVIHCSSALAAVLYILIGLLGAMAIPNVSANMLESMMSGAFGITMQVNASVFAFFIVGLGCPLFSVLARMNLTGSGLCSHRMGNILAVYLPFLCSWLFYQGDAITQILSWGGTLFTSVVAFVLPLLVSLHALDTSDCQGEVAVYGSNVMLTAKTQKRLLQILLVLSILSIIVAISGKL
eukprot:Nitzschia sp. Nitz4//scaffold8_size234185//51452//53067//NITZ4_001238-RA/size234185-augustus-gene-0.239-mRNA-1//1//CDS//3329559749//1116//frame0